LEKKGGRGKNARGKVGRKGAANNQFPPLFGERRDKTFSRIKRERKEGKGKRSG